MRFGQDQAATQATYRAALWRRPDPAEVLRLRRQRERRERRRRRLVALQEGKAA